MSSEINISTANIVLPIIKQEVAHTILNSFHPNYSGFNTKGRSEDIRKYLSLKYFDFNRMEINNLVLFWQETNDQLVYEAIFETYMILYKKLMPKFLAVSHTIRRAENTYDLDLFQDFIFIFNKCMREYKYVDNCSFKSYAMNWFQFYLGEQIRTQYFSLILCPQNIIKQERKKSRIHLQKKQNIPTTEEDSSFINSMKNKNYSFTRSDLSEDTITIEIEDKLIANIFDVKIIEVLEKIIKKGTIKMWHLDIFFKKHGIFTHNYKQTELAEIYKLSNSTISKIIKKVQEILSCEPYLKKLYAN